MSYAKKDGEQLIEASKSGDLATVQRLLNESVDVNYQDRSGRTALMGASDFGHVEVIKALLEKNAAVDIDVGGETALMKASCCGHIECVRWLLENGADITIKNNNGMTAKRMAQRRGFSDIVKLIDQVRSSHIIESYHSNYMGCLMSLPSFESTKSSRNYCR